MQEELSFQHLSPVQFEQLCFELLGAMGYENCDWRKGTAKLASPADDGCDILCQWSARYPDGTVAIEEWAVECKHCRDGAGVPTRELLGVLGFAMAEKPGKVLLITSGFLSNAAKEHIRKIHAGRPGYAILHWEEPTLRRLLKQHPILIKKFGLRNNGLDSAGVIEMEAGLQHVVERTERIVEEMKSLLKKPAKLKGKVIRIQAGYSSLSNVDYRDSHDLHRRRYGELLVEERHCLIQLLRKGAVLRVIIHPPSSPRINRDRARARLDLLVKFLEQTTGVIRRCEIAVSTEEGTNLLFLGNRVLYEGHKTEVNGGYGYTIVYRDPLWVRRRIYIFDQLFQSAREYTIRHYLPKRLKCHVDHYSPHELLRFATLRAVQDLRRQARNNTRGAHKSKGVL